MVKSMNDEVGRVRSVMKKHYIPRHNKLNIQELISTSRENVKLLDNSFDRVIQKISNMKSPLTVHGHEEQISFNTRLKMEKDELQKKITQINDQHKILTKLLSVQLANLLETQDISLCVEI